MKKPYMTTVKGSSGRDCVLIIMFELYGLSPRFLKVIYSGWVIKTPLSTFILEVELIHH